MPAYDAPLDQLLALGESAARAAEWPNYLALGLTREHVPGLVRMATDPALSRSTDAVAAWAPLHAWRALGQLGDPAAAAPLLELGARAEREDEDWAMSELPLVLGMLGPEALPALAAFLGRRDVGPFGRGGAAEAIAKLGTAHPGTRADCVAALAGALAHHTVQDRVLNGLLVGALLDLRATEAVDVMEQAFAAADVDRSMQGDWEDVQVALGLLDARRTSRPDYMRIDGPLAGLSRAELDARARRSREAAREAESVPRRAAADRKAARSKRKQAAASRRRNRRR